MEEIRAIVSGRVQRVMFRDFVCRKARPLGLKGYVHNLEDGTVEVIAQGERENLEKLIAYLHKGPFLAKVANVNVIWREPSERFGQFDLVY